MQPGTELESFEISVADFDLDLIPTPARIPGSPEFEVAVRGYYEDQLRKVADSYSITIENGTIRVTWRTHSMAPDALDEAVSALTRGDYTSGVQILELLLPSRTNDPDIHFNLGMAYSDLGKLDQARTHLELAIKNNPSMVNAKVALGVAFARLREPAKAAAVLKEAVLDDPDNGYALRNLGAVLMQLNRDLDDALRYLRRATELLPEDQQAWFGLGQAELSQGNVDEADRALIRAIAVQPHSPVAAAAKEVRSSIASNNFRKTQGPDLRMDAVQYCLAALRQFVSMTKEEKQRIGFEIATLGMNGINVNDPAHRYTLRSLPGSFSGLQLVCYEYVAFKQFAPGTDIGFDIAKEYEEAERMDSGL